jgi:hypothetical protein
MNEKPCLYISVDEYRELVRTQRDAEYLKAIMQERLKAYTGIKHDELEILCKMFLSIAETMPVAQNESW